MIGITEDELLLALEEAQSSAEDVPGLSLDELCIATGYGEKRVRNRLRELHRSGKLVAKQRQSTNISGQRCYIPVYSVKP